MRIARFLVVAALFAASIPVAKGGWVVTYQEEDSNKTEQVFVQDGKLAAGDMIVTGDALILLDHKSKSYWRGTADALCTAVKQMVDQMKASMPPAMREKMAPAGGMEPAREEIGTAEIAGYRAQGYRFVVSGNPVSEIWVSKDPRLAGLIGEAQRAGALGRKVSACMKAPMMAMMGGGDVSGTEAYEEVMEDAWVMKEPSGMSMRMTTRGGGQGSMKLKFKTVVSIEQKEVPASAFEPPAGYEQVDDFMALMERM